MATLNLDERDLPSLEGLVAIITGGSAGIGLATAMLMLEKGAEVNVLDLDPPPEEVAVQYPNLRYHDCDVTDWGDLQRCFDVVGNIDIVFVNAGMHEEDDYFADKMDEADKIMLLEPEYRVLDVNLIASYNTVKLAWSRMRKQGPGRPYSIVITLSIAAYAPEQAYPVYSGTKLALLGLIRSLRSIIIEDGITINGVAPGVTNTDLVPEQLREALQRAGFPICEPRFVGLALVYMAIGMQDKSVEAHGRDRPLDVYARGRCNGRVLLALGSRYTELEEPIAELRPFWLGRENAVMVRAQQIATDLRSRPNGVSTAYIS